jgi:hypothetical protein
MRCFLAALVTLAPVFLAASCGSEDPTQPQQQTVLPTDPSLAVSYLGRYPDNGTPNWGDNDTGTQGIAHDGSNWYFSATGTGTWGYGSNADWIIWRVPVAEAINQDFWNSRAPGVGHVRRTGVPLLHFLGVNHPGDIDCYKGYLLAPMRGPSGPLIVIFTAVDLEYVTHVDISATQTSIGWCAVNPAGDLVSSEDDAGGVPRVVEFV